MKAYIYFKEIDENTFQTFHIYAGNANEIEKEYKRLENHPGVFPLYLNTPKLNENRNYGIIINNNYFRIISENVLKEYLIDAFEVVETV